jgi:branched-chain amino acid transport system substrate-binding protein
MNRRGLWRFLALIFAFALVAAACGDSDDDGGGDASTDDTAASSDGDGDGEGDGGRIDADDAFSSSTTEGGGDTTTTEAMAEPETVEEMLAMWESQRQVIIDRITEQVEAGNWGVGDDNILRGPAGFEIDLNECPDDWSDTSGITDTEIRHGNTTAQSGTLAAYGNIAVGGQALFSWVNENLGGVGGRDMNIIVRDDGYVAAQTIEFVNELIESENIFTLTTLGSPNTLAVYDQLNEECIPMPWVQTAHPAWGDPVNHPWTNGGDLSYSSEAILWGGWIQANAEDQGLTLPVKVAGLVMDNDFGAAYELTFEEWAEEHPDVVSEFVAVRHDPAAPTLTNEMTTIAASDPDIFISMTAGNACLQAVQEAETSGIYESVPVLFNNQTCKSVGAYMTPAGDAADGWWIIGGAFKDHLGDQIFRQEVYAQWMIDILEAEGLDSTISLLGWGWRYNWPIWQVYEIADALPGGISRTNFILAVRSFDMPHPSFLQEIEFGFNGNDDSYYVEGSEISRFDVDQQAWIQIGDVIDLNGTSPNCAWDKDQGGCA